MSDCHRRPAPRPAFTAVRGASLQEIPESSGKSVSEFCRLRIGPTVQTLKSETLPYLNRFNQTIVSYDASKEEKVDALKKKNVATEQRLKERQL